MRRIHGSTPCVWLYILCCFSRGCFPGLSVRFVSGLAATYSSWRRTSYRRWTRTNYFGLGARTPFQDIRDLGMTHIYHGLSRTFPCVELKPIKFAVESSNELVYSITSFRGLYHGDGDADADRWSWCCSRLIEGFSQIPGKMRQTSMRCRLVQIDVYIEGRRLINCE